MKKYETILLDADQTIWDFNEGSRLALIETMKERSIHFTDEDFTKFLEINNGVWHQLELGTITKHELYRKRFTDLLNYLHAEGDPMEINSEYAHKLQSRCIMIENAEETVRELYKEYELYIITNGTKAVQESRMSKCPIKDCIKKMYISEDIGAQKPSIKFFDFVLSDIPQKDKSRILVVGDSLSSDILGGINAGLDTCWICGDNSINTDLKYTYKVKDIKQVAELLK